VSHPSLGADVVWGSIRLDRWRLRFESPAAIVEIPLSRLQMDIDSSGDTRISFTDPELPEWVICTFDAAILQHYAIRQGSNTRNQLEALQTSVDVKRRLKITGWFLLICAICAFGASLFMSFMVRSLAARVPAQWEKDLGDSLIEELKQEETFLTDTQRMARLEQAVAPLVATWPKSEPPLKFYILQHPLPNACALPGGHVLVTTALLDLVDRPEELAGVVAHELAHLRLKHGFRKIISAAGPYLIFRIFVRSDSGLLGMLGNSSQMLVRQSFSQEFELEADTVGWDSLVSAGIDPRGLTEMLKKLKAQQDHMRGLRFETGAFSSHPSTEKRIRCLEAKWEKFKDKQRFQPSGAHPG
jgi:beta-barrel assembly-enhancing protease